MSGHAAVDVPPVAEERARPRSIGRILVSDLVGVLVSCLLVVVAFSPVVFGGRTLSTAAKTSGTNGFARSPDSRARRARPTSGPTRARPAWQFEPWAEITHRSYADGERPALEPVPGEWRAASPRTCRAPSSTRCCSPSTCTRRRSRGTSPSSAPSCSAPLRRSCSDASWVSPWCPRSSRAPRSLSAAGSSSTATTTSAARTSTCPSSSSSSSSCCARGGFCPSSCSASRSPATSTWGCPRRRSSCSAARPRTPSARLVQERGRTGMRVSVARLGGAGLLGVMLAAPLLLLFFSTRSLSFNVHTSEFAKGSETDPQWAMLNWLVPYFQSHPRLRERAELVRRGGRRLGSRRRVGPCRDEASPHLAVRRARRRRPAQGLRVQGVRLGRATAGHRAGRLSRRSPRPSRRSPSRSSRASAYRWCGAATSCCGGS